MRHLAVAGLLLVLTAAPVAAQEQPIYMLSSGVTCHWASGATSSVAAARANYQCEDDTWLWGSPYPFGGELVMMNGRVPTPSWDTPLLSNMELVIVTTP